MCILSKLASVNSKIAQHGLLRHGCCLASLSESANLVSKLRQSLLILKLRGQGQFLLRIATNLQHAVMLEQHLHGASHRLFGARVKQRNDSIKIKLLAEPLHLRDKQLLSDCTPRLKRKQRKHSDPVCVNKWPQQRAEERRCMLRIRTNAETILLHQSTLTHRFQNGIPVVGPSRIKLKAQQRLFFVKKKKETHKENTSFYLQKRCIFSQIGTSRLNSNQQQRLGEKDMRQLVSVKSKLQNVSV